MPAEYTFFKLYFFSNCITLFHAFSKKKMCLLLLYIYKGVAILKSVQKIFYKNRELIIAALGRSVNFLCGSIND